VSPEDQVTITALINIQENTSRFDELDEAFALTQNVVKWVESVLTAHLHRTDGVQPLTIDYRTAVAGFIPPGKAVSLPTVRSLQVGTTATGSDD